MGFFLIMLALLPQASRADPLLADYANSVEWKGLLQYQKNFLGFERSEVDGESFFLSPDGATNPLSELKSTLSAFQDPIVKDEKGEDNAHAICRFPTRFAVLQKHFDLSLAPKPKCASLKVYLERIQNRKVSVVFSSYYSGSASSVFGHSFLKFSGDNENELFDTGINFAANPTTSNPILYSLYGLIGVFPSTFSAQPFYYKVREYNDFESRDLWAYELKLTQAQRELLISHLWELGSTYFDYFYLSENCSYQILRAIEGAVPEIRFFDRRLIFLIPSESIKLLYRVPGLVGKISYRPSIRNVTFDGYSRLSAVQKMELELNLQKHTQISSDAEVVDVLMDAIDLNFADKIVKNDLEITAWKERVLKQRASLNRQSVRPQLETPEDEKPSVGHGTKRLSLGLEVQSGQTQTEHSLLLQARASHHDLLDPSVGYPRHLHIDFGRIAFRYGTETKRFLMDDLTIVDLTALSLEHPLYSQWSYAVRIGYTRRWFEECNDPLHCPALALKAGFGKTYPLFQKHTVFGLLNFEPSYASGYQDAKFKLAVQPSLAFIFEWQKFFKTEVQANAGYVVQARDHWQEQAIIENRIVWHDQFGLDVLFGWAKQNSKQQNRTQINALYYF